MVKNTTYGGDVINEGLAVIVGWRDVDHYYNVRFLGTGDGEHYPRFIYPESQEAR